MKINRQLTQIDGTKSTYEKVGDYISVFGNKDSRILDYGGGKCHGRGILMDRGYTNVVDLEPFAKDDVNPVFTKVEDVYEYCYDFVICNYVINVIEDKSERHNVIRDVLFLLDYGGRGIITSRPWKSIEGNKTNKKYRDGYVNSRNTFQRGYEVEELKELVEDLGREMDGDFVVEPTKIGGVGVIVQKL